MKNSISVAERIRDIDECRESEISYLKFNRFHITPIDIMSACA